MYYTNVTNIQRLSFNFQNYPVDQLLLYESKALETHFKSKMKEVSELWNVR